MMLRPVSILVTSLFLLSMCELSQTKTVVFFSFPHIANVRTFTNAARALAAKGHDVYVPVQKFMLDQKVVNTDGINVIEYGKNLANFDHDMSSRMISKFWNNETVGFDTVTFMLDFCHNLIQGMLSDQALVSKLRDIKPDLFVLTNGPPIRNLVIFPYMLNSKLAYLSPFNDYIGQRSPFMLSSSPNQLNKDFQDSGMPFVGRLKNSLMNLGILAMHIYVTSDEMVAKFAPDRPRISTDEIMTQAEIFLVETDPIMDFGRPELPNTRLIGSTAGIPPKVLKEPFKTFMDTADQGVVLVTFGSIVSEYPEYVSSKLLRALQSLNQKTVWRAASVKSPNPDKILTYSWVPQNEILAHKNTRLFISHCGANGQYEAMYHGVPTLCMPLTGDQNYNAQRGKVKGFGLIGDIRYDTSDDLVRLMKEMLENDKYKKAITTASDMYRELYKLPINKSAYWLDHVLRYGGSHLRTAGQNMSIS